MKNSRRRGKQVEEGQETVRCSRCERTVLKQSAYEINGEYYCCPDCFEGKTCDCQ